MPGRDCAAATTQSYYIKQRLPKYQPSALAMWGITAGVAALFLVQVRTQPLLVPGHATAGHTCHELRQ